MKIDLKKHPQRINGIRWTLKKDKKVYAVNPYTDEIFNMNLIGSYIWQLCNGNNSITKVINSIDIAIKNNAVSRNKIEKDVKIFIKKMINHKMIELF